MPDIVEFKGNGEHLKTNLKVYVDVLKPMDIGDGPLFQLSL
jgi:hypothetical protein